MMMRLVSWPAPQVAGLILKSKTLRHFFCGCLMLLLLTFFAAGPAYAAERVRAGVSDLTAVYIFNFIRFTDWPENSLAKDAAPDKDSVLINVLHNQKIHDTLKRIIAKPAAQKLGLALQSCNQTSCIQNSSVLFIGESDRGHFSQLLKLVEGSPVLTISDVPGFAEQGGMVEIKYHNEKLTFVVNLQAVNRAGLYISAQLLQLGEIVGRDNE
ncbi:YfiR family protein [Mariprofundus micogutta]|nr:YfiR family protein [Mariprofundus micogutta]